MTRTSVLSLRPALAVGMAVVLSLALFGSHPAEAGNVNTVAISPTSKDIGVGSSTSVAVVAAAPAESLAAWVLDVAYDPEVIAFSSCTSIASPPGSLGVSDCAAKDTGGSPDDDAVAVVGAVLFAETERGLDGTHTLATITFDAVGEIGQCSDLTITIDQEDGEEAGFLTPDPAADSTHPTLTHGEICIVEDPGVDRLWGDFDCNNAVDPIDALKLLRADSGLSVAQAPGCPAPKATVSVDGTDRQWGDLDCSGGVDPIDALKTLRHDSGLTITQGAGCPAPASEVSVS